LFRLFFDVLKRRESRVDKMHADYGDMPRDRFTVQEKIIWLRDYLKTHGRFPLSVIFEGCISRGELVVTFLALLEMVRQGLMRVQQNILFKEIWCST
jgi:segregation and condensation protein A